jgi:pantoate--beta-alanine ligase
LFPPKKKFIPPLNQKNNFPYQSDLFKLWEGVSRPDHFQGVVQVVDRLFQLVKPTQAYFGEKDFQQLTVIKTWVKEKNIPVQITSCATLREKDGLAMSSRNRYLNTQERVEAVTLYQVLQTARKLFDEGKTDWNQIKKMALQKLSSLFSVDYFACVDSNNLKAQDIMTSKSRLIIAAKIGTVRLIDNIGLTHE